MQESNGEKIEQKYCGIEAARDVYMRASFDMDIRFLYSSLNMGQSGCWLTISQVWSMVDNSCDLAAYNCKYCELIGIDAALYGTILNSFNIRIEIASQ